MSGRGIILGLWVVRCGRGRGHKTSWWEIGVVSWRWIRVVSMRGVPWRWRVGRRGVVGSSRGILKAITLRWRMVLLVGVGWRLIFGHCILERYHMVVFGILGIYVDVQRTSLAISFLGFNTPKLNSLVATTITRLGLLLLFEGSKYILHSFL